MNNFFYCTNFLAEFVVFCLILWLINWFH